MTNMDLEALRDRAAAISAAIDRGEYKRGMWQRLLESAEEFAPVERAAVASLLTELSRQVHGINRFPRFPFSLALALEVLAFAASIWLLWWGSFISMLCGLTALAISLQPLIKVVTGLLLGVRYDYAFLWHVEPRFKMRYGTYFLMSPLRRVVFHAAGGVGTPVAMLVGAACFMRLSTELGYACLVFAVGAVVLQVGSFVAEWVGVEKVAGMRLANVTSPATAAFELKRMRGQQREA